MPIGVADPRAHDRDAGTKRSEERLARGRRAPVVGDLEQVQPSGTSLERLEEGVVHVLFDIARE
jgi:hypothetical protein